MLAWLYGMGPGVTNVMNPGFNAVLEPIVFVAVRLTV